MKNRTWARRSSREGEKVASRKRGSVGRKQSGQTRRVGDVMRQAYYCHESQPLHEAHKIMRENHLAFLSVVDDRMRIIGRVELA
jgi:CBS-domain-containing membrane protein